ncbi:hypothetical protein OUZ56_021723 [Daphnia magna]|uniref:Uncharacterized protein n=1 Tax=Daphnia magna TaxID=35525 RepID=A0ABR0AUT5_9CRUS|nr:hypothetical protein OUZ56_021723 [Daphnia magna]
MPHSGMQFSDEDLGCHVSYTTCLDVVVGPTLFNTDLSIFRTIQITSDTVICFQTPLGGLEPPAFRLTAERASQLRHKGIFIMMLRTFECVTCIPVLYSVNEGFHKQMFNQKLKSAPIGSSRGSSPTPKKPIGGLLRQLGESDSMFLITWNL